MEQNKENNLIFFDIKDIFNKEGGYFDFLNEKAKKFEELIFYIEDKTLNPTIRKKILLKVKLPNFDQQKTLLCFFEKYEKSQNKTQLLFEEETFYTLCENTYKVSPNNINEGSKINKSDIETVYRKASDYLSVLNFIMDYYQVFCMGLD